jgi:hypothetical protein
MESLMSLKMPDVLDAARREIIDDEYFIASCEQHLR